MRNRVTNSNMLREYLDLTNLESRKIEDVGCSYKWAITPYYASLMDRSDPDCPIRRQAVPAIEELSGLGYDDPLKEDDMSPVPGLVHKYPDRVAFTVSSECAMYCRHCTRKRFVGEATFLSTNESISRGISYIRKHQEIRDVLVTGGDPFLASDEWIDGLLAKIRAIDHVEIIRLGTRTLCTLPFRVTENLCRILSKHHPVWVNTQFNHPKELTPEAAEAVDKLLRAGVPVGNQSVLLRGINDEIEVMKQLVQGLVKMRVRPYYLYQCDFVKGTSHFWSSMENGNKLIAQLQGYTTGFAVPTFVVDTPIGKIPVNSDNVIANGDSYVLGNYKGQTWTMPIVDTGQEYQENKD